MNTFNHNIGSDQRFSYMMNSQFPKPNLFNGKKIAEQLLQERETLLSFANDFSLWNAKQMKDSIDQAKTYNNHLQAESERLKSEINEREMTIDLASVGFYDFEHPAQSSIQLNRELKNTRSFIKEAIRDKRAAKALDRFTFNNSEAQGRKFVNDMVKLMLRAYNAEAENAVMSIKSEKTQSAINRLNRSKEQVEKLGKMIGLEINPTFHNARIREIELAFDYHRILRIEKEHAREEAERLREEKRAEAEIKKKEEALKKELQQKRLAFEQLKNYNMSNPVESQKAKELFNEIQDIEKSIREAEERAANLKAGYVYVISNIGAFGEGRIKIGMTRRIDPMDRIKELGSASVPFQFDVHLIHYSENALDIERKLHEYFASRRINMINRRKEHFYATPQEVKNAIMSLDGSITTFVEKPQAEDYYESLKIQEKTIEQQRH